MAQIGALEHLQMARRDCPAFKRTSQVLGHQALRKELVVLRAQHL